LEIVKKFEFHESAGHKIRKNFDEMMEFVKQNDDIRAILTYRVDRITRNFRDAVALDNLRVEHDKELHFANDRLVLKADSVGRDIQDWDLQVFLAKQTLNRLKEDGFNSFKYKVLNGEWAGKASCGYKNVTLEGNKKWVEVDDERSDLTIKAFELFATGNYSYSKLAEELAGLGLTTNTKVPKPMYKSYLEHHIINSPFYYGAMRYKGKLYPHNYEKLIPKPLYDKCQGVIASWNRKPFKYGAMNFAFKGILECSECNKALSYYKKKGFTYVRCHHCKAVHTREDQLLGQVAHMFKELQIPSDVVSDIKEKLNETYQYEQDFYKSNVIKVKAEIKKNGNRIEQMYLDRLDGRITHDEYDKLVVKFKKTEQELLHKLEQYSKADETFLISSSYVRN